MSSEISKKVGSEVKIEKIEIGLFNRVILYDIKIKDKKGTNIISAKRLSAKIKLRSLVNSPLTIRTIELYGAKINIYKEKETLPYNFNFILDSFSSNKSQTDSPLDLRIKSIILSRASVDYNIKDKPKRNGFDINHIQINEMDASIKLQIIKSDSFKIRVRNLAFKEKSGFRLRRSYIIADIYKSNFNIPILELETNRSRINLKNIALFFSDKNELSGQGNINNTDINLSEANAFFPKLNLPDKKYSIESKFYIKNNVIYSPNLNIYNGHDANIVLSAQYENQKKFRVNIKNLYLAEKELTSIAKLVTKDTVYNRFIKSTKDVRIRGVVESNYNGLKLQGSLDTQIGNLKYSGHISNKGLFIIKTSTNDFQLGSLISKSDIIGNTAFDLKCKGTKNAFTVKADIHKLEANKYNYTNIALNLIKQNKTLLCDLKAEDPNIKSVISAKLNNAKNKKHIEVDGDIINMNPNTLKLTSKYGDSQISFKTNINILANNLDDACGSISVNNLIFKTQDSTFNIKEIRLKATPVTTGRKINIDGDFGNAEIAGYFNFNTLPDEVMSIIRSKSNDNLNYSLLKSNNTSRRAANYNNFNFHTKIVKPELINLFSGLNIKLGNDNYINGYIDSKNKKLLIEGSLSRLSWKEQELSDLSIYCKGNDNTMRSNIHFAKILKEGKTNVEIEAHKGENGIDCNIMWKNKNKKEYSGNIIQTITFPNKDASIINFNIAQSTVVIEDTIWNISPALISYSNGNFKISDFNLSHAQKHLSLNGNISKQKSDSLKLNLSGIRIRDIMDMVAFDDVEFDGIATGTVTVSDFFGTPAVNTSLKVTDFKFNNAPMGYMNLIGTWNNELKQIDLEANINENEGNTDIKGFINTAQNTIDLHFNAEKTNALFLNKFLPEALQFKQGRTTGKLQLHGKLNAMNLKGTQTLSNATIYIDPLGTTYTMDGNIIELYTDTINFKSFKLIDKYGNQANMTGNVTHKALHDFRYDLNISAERFLAYDRQRNNEYSFWGTAFTTGDIHIHGLPGLFYTEATVQPTENTVFTYNADKPDSPENAQLLTYHNADENQEIDEDSISPNEPNEKVNEKTTDIRLNFTLNLTPEAEVKVIMNEEADNTISTRGTGTVHALFYNKGNFEMFGNYVIQSGTYKMTLQDFIHKDFHFRNGGTVTFNGDPFAGDLNLQAVYTVPSVSLSDLMADGNLRDNSVKVDCVMNFSGSLGQPIVKFDLDMPSVSTDEQQMVRSLIATPEDMNMQIVYLLSFGRFYTYNYASQNMSASQSQSALAMNSFLSNTLSSNLNSFLSNFTEESKWTFGTNLATGNDGWNDMDVEGMFTGHLLNNRLILNGNLGYRDRAAYNSNFVGDFSVIYLLNPRGTIQLKAYSESNDRYFTKSTLTTQGGGIIFKRDFTKLKDIFKRSKKKQKK